MALTKVGSGGIENVTNAANATFLTIDASEQITVASEGGAVTTSVQQGLAKVWLDYKGDDTVAINDSFNVASVTDSGVGRYDPSFTNAMSTANYAITTGTNGGHMLIENASANETGKTYLSLGNSTFGSFVDCHAHFQICGDLA